MLEVQPFDDSLTDTWDAWCASSINATLLHTRRFLSYHGQRFKDRSVMLRSDGRLVGVLPAAEHRQDAGLVVSHPGATYGGIVHDGWLTGQRMIEAVDVLRTHFQRQQAHTLRYKPIPHIYTRAPAQDDLYALFRCGARLQRCDLACCIDLAHPGNRSERRDRSLKKALRKGVEVSDDALALTDFWQVLQDNLQRKHEASPVHSLDEITELMRRFPDHIQLVTARAEGEVVSGILLFNGQRVWHAQYIASNALGYDVSALDAVFDHAIHRARQAGARFFDFGTSNESEGRILNDSLYRFKAEFGASGVAYEHHDIPLQ